METTVNIMTTYCRLETSHKTSDHQNTGHVLLFSAPRVPAALQQHVVELWELFRHRHCTFLTVFNDWRLVRFCASDAAAAAADVYNINERNVVALLHAITQLKSILDSRL